MNNVCDPCWYIKCLGSTVFTQDEKDNLQATAFQVANGLTRRAYNGLRKFTKNKMTLHSKYVADRILEGASELTFKIYDCCIQSCICFAGEFENATICLICEEPRYDQCKKAQNRFCYILIIPQLQAMFRDPTTINLLLHRVWRELNLDTIKDVLDGGVIQRLLNSQVKIDGEKQQYKYGEFKTNIFLALTCDGVSVHKGLGVRWSKMQYSCYPMEVIILNLSPTICTQDWYVFSLGVIPGPWELKHFNSFCWPLYQECLCGLEGIPTYHTIRHNFFPLHVYLIHIFGDLIAMIKALGTLGVGVIKPCHSCHIEAICDIHAKWKTYYLLLTIPGHSEPCLQEILNNLQTHMDYLETYHRLDIATTEAEWKAIQKEMGIKHPSIFSLLPYFDMGHAVLGGFMHTIYINLFKALIKLWHGDFKGLDTGTSNYTILAAIWEQIGIETRDAVKTIPSSFVWSMLNIDTNFRNFTAEDSAFFMTWLVPYLLARRLPEPYYSHLLKLVDIVKICTGFGITMVEHAKLSIDIYEWQLKYEE